MAITETQIETTKQEYTCDDCQQGVYRLAYELPISNTNPKQYLHTCTHCKKQVHFTVIYPVLVFKEKKFMLADSLRFEPGVCSVSSGEDYR